MKDEAASDTEEDVLTRKYRSSGIFLQRNRRQMKEKRKQDVDRGEHETNENGLIFHRVPSVGKMCFKTNTIDVY